MLSDPIGQLHFESFPDAQEACVTQDHHLLDESVVRLEETARFVGPGRGGRPTHPSTIWRWVFKGCRAPDGRRVRLEAVRVGAHWVTSREAIRRFSDALTPRLDDEPVPSPRTSTTRQRASQRAAARLERAGI